MVTFIDAEPSEATREHADATLASIFVTPEGIADPLPLYAELHRVAPVHISSLSGLFLTRHDDCRALLRDNRFGNGLAEPRRSFGASEEVVAYRQQVAENRAERPLSMLALDPPDHTRQRSLVSRAFTPRTIEVLRPRIAHLVDEMIADMPEGPFDLMEAIAKPLPVTVISEMLGVPRTDWPTMREQVTDLVLGLEPNATLEELKLATAASDVLWEYFIDLVRIRRAEPQDDLISALIAASDGDDTLSEGEILAVAMLLFAAGAETTTNLIGNGVHQLLSNPDQMAMLWADPSLVPSMVEEVLRHDSPVQIDGRMCLEPAELAGVSLEPGDRVTTLLGAANHDPAHYDNPNQFDITRFVEGKNAEPVMSFASGIHYCLGASLARAEGQEVFSGLVRNLASLHAEGDRNFRPRLVLRGLDTCPVSIKRNR